MAPDPVSTRQGLSTGKKQNGLLNQDLFQKLEFFQTNQKLTSSDAKSIESLQF